MVTAWPGDVTKTCNFECPASLAEGSEVRWLIIVGYHRVFLGHVRGCVAGYQCTPEKNPSTRQAAFKVLD